jgi:oligoribonuclease
MSEKQNDLIVWIDCEMTGLDIEKDALIEIAVLVTDSSLNILGDGVDLVIKPPQAALDQMPDIVRQMHSSSGLLDELENGITLQEAETLVMEYIRKFVPDARKAPLAGNSIGTDRAFIARDLKALEVYLHYRVIDVSSIKELVRRWYPRAYFASPKKLGNHRALGDIKDSIIELAFYRRAIFVPFPGPDTDALRQISTEFTPGSAGQ